MSRVSSVGRFPRVRIACSIVCNACVLISDIALDPYFNVSVDIVSKIGNERQVHETLYDCLTKYAIVYSLPR